MSVQNYATAPECARTNWRNQHETDETSGHYFASALLAGLTHELADAGMT